jgi:hypothetical protein
LTTHSSSKISTKPSKKAIKIWTVQTRE